MSYVESSFPLCQFLRDIWVAVQKLRWLSAWRERFGFVAFIAYRPLGVNPYPVVPFIVQDVKHGSLGQGVVLASARVYCNVQVVVDVPPKEPLEYQNAAASDSGRWCKPQKEDKKIDRMFYTSLSKANHLTTPAVRTFCTTRPTLGSG
mmetsp:Transcript_9061/g.17017  ORF Transcript_9061/g.17017 Transcript_9061/m.17017 type:complete len:148 (-) Transcript_9061:1016-1459(-)